MPRACEASSMFAVLLVAAIAINGSNAYVFPIRHSPRASLSRPNASRRLGPNRRHMRNLRQQNPWPLFSDPDDDTDYDPNQWISSDDESSLGDASWEESLARRNDGSLWSSFASSEDDGSSEPPADGGESTIDAEDGGEDAWLDALASIAADEVG